MQEGLSKEENEIILALLDSSVRPLFFFHDDPDGLASFLLFYRYKGDGRGVVVKSTPRVDGKFLKIVKDYCPDRIFILDIALIDQEFIDQAGTDIVMIDHHEPISMHAIKYFNPRLKQPDRNIPCSLLCHDVIPKANREMDEWIAMVGSVGDWHLPMFSEDFAKRYPMLLPEKIINPAEALFNTRLGELILIFSFILKGKTKDIHQSIKYISRVKDPEEILSQMTHEGTHVYKKARSNGKTYFELLQQALDLRSEDMIFEFIYKDDTTSFTKELSNILLFKNPGKIIIVGRKKSDEVKLSLRSDGIKLPKILEHALGDVEGYGGGHEYACGACVKAQDYKKFLENIKKQVFLKKKTLQ